MTDTIHKEFQTAIQSVINKEIKGITMPKLEVVHKLVNIVNLLTEYNKVIAKTPNNKKESVQQKYMGILKHINTSISNNSVLGEKNIFKPLQTFNCEKPIDKYYFNTLPIANNIRTFSVNTDNKRLKPRKCVFFIDETVKRINEDLFSNGITVLSRPKQSASNSIVIYNKDAEGYGYIYKISGNTISIKKEATIYEKLNQLLFHKITPHLFLTFGSGLVEIPSGSRLYNLITEVNKTQHNNNNSTRLENILNPDKPLYCLINETGPDTSRIMPYWKLFSPDAGNPLREYLFSLEYFKPNPDSKTPFTPLTNWTKLKQFFRVIYNLAFQLKWTNFVFRLINFNQGDTHLGNIMVIFNENNVFEHPELFERDRVKYKSYTFTTLKGKVKTYYLEDLGIDLYVFDFDKGKFSKGKFLFSGALDNKTIEVDFRDNIQEAIRPTNTELKDKDDITNNDFISVCSNIYKLDLYNIESRHITEKPILSSIEDYMDNYLNLVFPYIPYLKIYKDNPMLVTEDLNTDFSQLKNLYSTLKYLKDAKDLLDLEKPEPNMDYIKKNITASYSTKILTPQYNNSI